MNGELKLNECVVSNQPFTGEQLSDNGRPAWLASLMLKRREFLPRFTLFYRKLAELPRPWQKRLQRKLAVTLTGAALLLALMQPQAQAATDNVITVVNGEVADVQNNKCSLVEAIINARTTRAGQLRSDCAAGNLSGPDTIVLPNNGSFVLTAAHNEQFGPTGLPVITSAMTIEGHGSTIRRSNTSDTPRFRILAVDTSGNLTLRNTTIANGHSYDGNYGNGGGIATYGTLTLSGSTLSGNRAINFDSGGQGGGLYIGRNGQATISDSAILDNGSAGYYLCEGGGINIRGEAIITNSTIADNFSGGCEGSAGGGGVFVGYSGNATITGSTIRGNVADPYFEWFSYDIHPGIGGGLTNMGTTLIANTTISGNAANNGGGIANLVYGDLTVVQSTVTGNDAFLTDVGGYWGAEGGDGGGIFAGRWYGSGNCSATTLKGTIVSGNTSPFSSKQVRLTSDASCNATVNVNAFNIFGQDGSAGLVNLSPGATDIVPTDGLATILSPLGNNGGPTLTHALPSGSPAIDRVPNNQCTAAPVNGVDQRGEPRNQDGNGSPSSNECDIGAFELQGSQPQAAAFFASATGSGTVGGVAFAPADILKYDPTTGWTMYFDGSDVGIKKNVSGFEILDNGHILLSFAANQSIPGLGTVTPQDVVGFIPSSTGNQTAGSFHWYFDGSAFKLTTTAEKIDALGLAPDGRLLFSTTGTAAVSLPNGNTLKAQDEDALGFNLNQQSWSLFFDGTPLKGLKAEDINALWVDPDNGDIYVSLASAFNLGGVTGNAKDIVKLRLNNNGSYTPSLHWDGSANGFPSNLDGLEMAD